MIEGGSLQDRFAATAARHPHAEAVEDPGKVTVTYRELDALSDRFRDRLRAAGVGKGDRVGLYLRKSVDAVAALFGVLKAGAAYVPVDPEAPARRAAYILGDCSVKVVLTEASLSGGLEAELATLGAEPGLLVLGDEGPLPLRKWLDGTEVAFGGASPVGVDADDLAYILYTSGSTGKPKGVMLSQRAALSFVDWCVGETGPTDRDVYSSHAPLHFDLSIHDVFVPLTVGAKLVLVGEEMGKDPHRLAELISCSRITVWYSTPSILSLLSTFGKMNGFDYSRLRVVLFAGEVFPIPQLRGLRADWPEPRFYNLYGPTETNVCTYFEVPRVIPETRTNPFPIGGMCAPHEGRVVDDSGVPVPAGTEGELIVRGPGVMQGYWNLPEQTRAAFLRDEEGRLWYRTGDMVVEEPDGVYLFHGRRDRMVKRRGYRIELGEIEAALALHSALREVAVVATGDSSGGVRIVAFVVAGERERPSIIGMKRHSFESLPRYMVPDAFRFLDALPRTSTNKIDYQGLLALN